MKANNIYGVILAGGKGERLWPLSRSTRPKQALDLQPGISLVQATLNRIASVVCANQRFIVTTQEQQALIKSIIQDSVHIIAEPLSKNTAPAILLTCLDIVQQDPQAVIFFLPADHFIKQEDMFADALTQGVAYAQTHQEIILLGVKPRSAATGYGYIEMSFDSLRSLRMTEKGGACTELVEVCKHSDFNKVLRFHEKPNQATAQLYSSLPSMLWNIGVFCAQAKVFIEQYKKHAPEIFKLVNAFHQTKNLDYYTQLPNISFDYAILEKSKEVVVKPLDIMWSDIGNLHVFLALKQEHENHKNVITLDAYNNLVHADKEKLIALLGVSDLCIVQTEDVLLIAKQADVEKVKSIVGLVKKTNEHMV